MLWHSYLQGQVSAQMQIGLLSPAPTPEGKGWFLPFSFHPFPMEMSVKGLLQAAWTRPGVGVQRRRSPTCHSAWELPAGSRAQSGNDSNTSKAEICAKKLCQLQTKPEFPAFALGNESRFASIHQDCFQCVSRSSWKISFVALYYIIMEFVLCLLCRIVK